MEARYVAAREALLANLNLQRRFEETLKELEQGINANADQQAKIQAAALQMNRSGWYTGLREVGFPGIGMVGPRAIGPSRFWMSGGSVPEPNEDTRRLYEAYTYLPHTFALRKWSAEEDADLHELVLHAIQEKAREDFIADAIRSGARLTQEQRRSQMEKAASLTLDSPESEKIVLAFDPRRWATVATQLGRMRSGADCQNRWLNHLCPSKKRHELEEDDAWDKEDDETLITTAAAHQERDWEKIAAGLDNGFSALQCLSRFRQLQSHTAHKPWSDAEIRQLQLSYVKHANKASFWKAVAADLPGRTFNQCMHYWRNQMDRTVKKGKWSPEEDEVLKTAVEVFGKKWARVAEAVPSRNQVQVRERWVNVLDPDLKRGKAWTAEEDAILVAGLQECKNSDGSIRWADIARRLPGRTDDVVANHAITLRNFELKKGAFKERQTATKKSQKSAEEKSKPLKGLKRKADGSNTARPDNKTGETLHGEDMESQAKRREKGSADKQATGRKRQRRKTEAQQSPGPSSPSNEETLETHTPGGGANARRKASGSRPKGRRTRQTKVKANIEAEEGLQGQQVSQKQAGGDPVKGRRGKALGKGLGTAKRKNKGETSRKQSGSEVCHAAADEACTTKSKAAEVTEKVKENPRRNRKQTQDARKGSRKK